MSNSAMNCVAVIVTFNKLELLKRCVSSVIGQTSPPSKIIVVDNQSSDGTAAWLAQQTALEVLTLSTNSGGAGGFNAGMKRAMEFNPDWIWLMDDDSIPAPEALERLSAAAAKFPRTTFLNSNVVWKDGSPCRMNIPPPVWEWTELIRQPEALIPLKACSFVSCLVNARYVPVVGYPIKEFFIWYDDFEYTQRLAAISPGLFVRDSIVTHETAENTSVDWSRVNKQNYWKYSWGMRNEMSLLSHGKEFRLLKCVAKFAEVYSQLSRGKVSWYLRAKLFRKAALGMFWDYRRHIEYPNAAKSLSLSFERGEVKTPVYSGEGWTAVWGNEYLIQTHPPRPGSEPDDAASVVFRDVSARAGSHFNSTVYIGDTRAKPVRFCVEAISNAQVISRQEKLLSPQDGMREIVFPLPSNHDGQLDLRLYCLMDKGAGDFSYASSYWLAPRLIQGA